MPTLADRSVDPLARADSTVPLRGFAKNTFGTVLRNALRAGSILVALSIASATVPAVAHAAALSITPATIDALDPGPITLDITGLAGGESVLVESFLDLNRDGAINDGDLLTLSFQVTDGQALSIDGVRDTNVPGDEDGAADGQIRCVIRLSPSISNQGVTANKTVGQFVYRVSPVTGGFTPATAVFTVTQFEFRQRVVGTVTSGGSAVPYAFAFLTDPAVNGGPILIALTDAGGNFTLPAAPGSYALAVVKPGFLFDFATPRVITIDVAATVTENVSLAAADRTISGRLTDLDSGAGIPGVQMFVQSDSGLATLGFSDASGNFTLPVSSASSRWRIDPSEKIFALLGYLYRPDRYSIDTGGGDVSGFPIQVPKATALIFGRLRNEEGNVVRQVSMYVDNDEYEGSGLTDEFGSYVVGVTAGTWDIEPYADDLAVYAYLPTSVEVTVGEGQARFQDVTVHRNPTPATPTPTPMLGCVGDCDASGSVTIDELITLVSIALGGADVSRCPAGDPSGDGNIAINELVAAVNSALNGC